MKASLQIIMKTLKQYCSAGREYVWEPCKKGLKKLLYSHYRYILRAILVSGFIIYLCFLLSDFTTIPVRDYYFDIYSASYDSIIPDIRVVVGNTNTLNTYSDEFDSQGDSISCRFNFTPHSPFYESKYRIGIIVRPYHTVYKNMSGQIVREEYIKDTVYEPWPTVAGETIGLIMDSVYRLSQQDEQYASFLGSYEHDKKLQFNEKNLDTLSSSYIYIQAYLHRYSSMPIGYRKPKMVREFSGPTQFYIDQSNRINEAWNAFPTSQGKTGIGDTLLYNKLSQNHSYYSTNSLIVKSPGCREGITGIRIKSSNRMTRSDKLGRLFPRMNLFLSRENIALQEYRFCIHPHDIDAYSITLQTRGGAIIQNNPSDELQVLNLHDTRIIKRRTISIPKYTLVDELPIMDEKYYNSDVFVSIPENDGLQYIRLFFVTMVIGLLLEFCCKDIIRFFRERSRSIAEENCENQ